VRRVRSIRSTPSRLPFDRALAAVAVAAMVGRVVYAIVYDAGHELGGDAIYYHWQGRALADGLGYIEPFEWRASGARIASAYHPPLYSTFLGLVSLTGATSVLAHRIASAALGAVTVLAVGLLGGRMGGRRVGRIAAVLAALYPPLWIADTQLLSEGLYAALLVAAAVLAVDVAGRARTSTALALGAVVAAAALTRSEAILLALLLVLPAAWCGSRVTGSRRWRPLGAASVGLLLVVAPWTFHNATRFERLVPISTGLGNLLVVSNCDDVYRGSLVGYWSFTCAVRAAVALDEAGIDGDESERDHALRSRALDYVGDHAGDVPRVVAARVGRTFGLFRPAQQHELERIGEDRGDLPTAFGAAAWYVLASLAVAAAFAAARRGERRALVVPAAYTTLVLITVAIGYGTVRFRVPVDVVVPALAACAIDGVWRRWRAPPAANR
jgi:4-amino-4-deoxy-L-arabinose transferase-like glycosyltransferase